MTNKSGNLTLADIDAAAETLRKLTVLYDYGDPNQCSWSAADLMAEKPHVAEYLEKYALIGDIVTQVENLIISGQDIGTALRAVLDSYEVRVGD